MCSKGVNNLSAALAADVDKAFPALVKATQDRLYSLALSFARKAADADDVTQDAYVRAYRALRTYPPARIRVLHVRPWLAKIALNVWRNRVRSHARDPAPLLEEPAGDETDAPAARFERSESVAQLRALVAKLPERYRVAVQLRHVYDLPYAEAARVLGIPVGTLKANVHRGTRMLRDAFERRAKVNGND